MFVIYNCQCMDFEKKNSETSIEQLSKFHRFLILPFHALLCLKSRKGFATQINWKYVNQIIVFGI